MAGELLCVLMPSLLLLVLMPVLVIVLVLLVLVRALRSNGIGTSCCNSLRLKPRLYILWQVVNRNIPLRVGEAEPTLSIVAAAGTSAQLSCCTIADSRS